VKINGKEILKFMDESRYETNPVLKLTFQFSLLLIKYCEILNEQKKFVVSKQLLRSGTSIGANVVEAQNAESKADFIHKMKIAAKEAEENQYWLLLCKYSNFSSESSSLLSNLENIHKVLGKIISSSKKVSV
jgi:four helix bundle protein